MMRLAGRDQNDFARTWEISFGRFLMRQITLKAALVILAALSLSACSAIASRNNTGVVVARSAQIRSSTAVVAADLLEVSRGDAIDILDTVDIPDPSDNSKKERWFRVRARDEEKTEGWIEARAHPKPTLFLAVITW